MTFTKEERHDIYVEVGNKIAQNMRDELKQCERLGFSYLTHEFVCWHLGDAAHGVMDYYSPDYYPDWQRTNDTGGRLATERLTQDFPEFALFRPKGKSPGLPWLSLSMSTQKANEQRLLALAFCVAMTEDGE